MLEKINEEIKTSMKSGNKFRLSVIRMLKSAIQLEMINKKNDLTDDEIINVIKKQVKMRKDSILEYEKYDKIDQVNSLKEEIKILEKYLPEEMSEDEINNILDLIFDSVKPDGLKDLGVLMKTAKTDERLKNADMSLINQLIKARLS